MKQPSLCIMGLLFLVTGCHQPAGSVVNPQPVKTNPQSQLETQPKSIETAPPTQIKSPPKDHPRWLMTQRYNVDSQDTWVRATFDAKRNKVSIDIRNIDVFAIDTRQIHINWNRPVILGINGRNSELKQRDYPVLRFELDEYNQWQVVEP